MRRETEVKAMAKLYSSRVNADRKRQYSRNVQVTLQILAALINRCPRDLAIYSTSALNILSDALQTRDVTLLEESVPTFEAFCAYYNPAILATDPTHVHKYDEVIDHYASIALEGKTTFSNTSKSVPLTLRFRTAGLKAIKSFVASGAFNSDNGPQLRVIMPAILQNLYYDQRQHLSTLQLAENAREKFDKDQKEFSYRGRQSIAVPRATSDEVDPSISTGTTEDADAKANEEVGVLALQALREIFSGENRGQLRVATSSIVSFTSKQARSEASNAQSSTRASWTTDVFESICRWTPVQERFIILVTMTENLTKSPVVEDDLDNQLALVRNIGWLLRSSVNFIGLSVIDILISLIQHVLRLLQLGHAGHRSSPNRHADGHSMLQSSPPGSSARHSIPGIVKTPSPVRITLLDELQNAIADLATHIYYSDQVGDMISTLLMRLKPTAAPGIPNTATAIENPGQTANAIADSSNLHAKPHTDDFFSFSTARILALGAVKKILTISNHRRKDGSGRNRVEVLSWDGTQWLLRDPDARVRKVYVEAILTWLDLEVDQSCLLLPQEDRKRAKPQHRDALDGGTHAMARRAISNASRNSNPHLSLRTHSTFLQLLHLAIYENAIEYNDSKVDILLLHLLLTQLIKKLGLNTVRHGLPMIFRLQEDIKTLPEPASKDAVGSLVHGYFWALGSFFMLDATVPGQAILTEIRRRGQTGSWIRAVQIPPLPVTEIDHAASSKLGASEESLKPFTMRHQLVEVISESHQLPNSVREQLLGDWSREMCVAAAEKVTGTLGGATGSMSGTGSNSRQAGGKNGASKALLGVNGAGGAVPGVVTGPAGYTPRSSSEEEDEEAEEAERGEFTPTVEDLKKILETGVDVVAVRREEVKRNRGRG